MPLSKNFNILSSMSSVEGARRVLCGNLGAYINFGIAKIWDAAAMCLAIEEAGGVACSPSGGPIEWGSINCDWIVAGNQLLADRIIEHSRNWQGRT
jgi:fructose-1,6-bisphosphatase/inositol monophosphatase family enzyme